MQKDINFFKLRYSFKDNGFSISNFKSDVENFVIVEYEKDRAIYSCNNNFEASCLMFVLLEEYTKKKKIVEEILDTI